MQTYILNRTTFTDRSTIGELFLFDNPFRWVTLEDVDRGLNQGMSIESIRAIKIPKHTAIPYGTYPLVIDFSDRFQRLMPHILSVPGFNGIRIHSGNRPEDTEGCPILGKRALPDWVIQSRIAYGEFIVQLQSCLEAGSCQITVTKNYQPLTA